MPDVTVFSIGAAVSTGIGGICFIAALYFNAVTSRQERSVKEIIGDETISPSEITEMLKQFKDDEGRLKALECLLDNDRSRASVLYNKIRSNIDVKSLVNSQSRQQFRFTRACGSIFIVLAIILACVSFANTTPNKTNKKINEQLVPSMIHNLDTGRYTDAETIADEILELDPNNLIALNTKGSVAFYHGQYAEAITLFKRALASDQNDMIIRRNLADAFVENGDYQEAIRQYIALNDTGNAEWKFHLARAYLYAEDYQKYLDYVKEIPTAVFGGHPRMIQAAALAGLMNNSPESEKKSILSEIKQNLTEGRKADPSYWDLIFSGGKDEHIGYSKVLELVGPIYKSLQSGNT